MFMEIILPLMALIGLIVIICVFSDKFFPVGFFKQRREKKIKQAQYYEELARLNDTVYEDLKEDSEE